MKNAFLFLQRLHTAMGSPPLCLLLCLLLFALSCTLSLWALPTTHSYEDLQEDDQGFYDDQDTLDVELLREVRPLQIFP
jgi:hypothetical protein